MLQPKPTVQGTNHDSESVFIAHFAEQKRIYGQPQVCINLIDSKKSEGMLASKFMGLFNNSRSSHISNLFLLAFSQLAGGL